MLKRNVMAMAMVLCVGQLWAATPLTGPVGINNPSPQRQLEISGPSLPGIRLLTNASTSSYVEILDKSANQFMFEKTAATGECMLDINTKTTDHTSPSYFRMFRDVNTTGMRGLYLYRGNGTATLDTMIGVGGTETFFQNTKVGINREPQTGYSLDVQGAARVTGNTTMTGNATVTGETTTAVVNITGGSDLSERFVIAGKGIQPGTVVCIDAQNKGGLLMSHKAYDHKVAGIVSGAGGIKPGLIMGQNASVADGRLPVALSGRAFCLADATKSPIQLGDLLTTSAIPGHAMKVRDHARAQGAIIGKAMTSLKSGKGMVLVLISLQ